MGNTSANSEPMLPCTNAPEHFRALDLHCRDIISREQDGTLVKMCYGTKQRISAEDEETKRMLQSSEQLYDFYRRSDKYKKFVFEVILSTHNDCFEKYLEMANSDPDFFKIASNNIENLHPVMALRILLQCGFNKHQEYDPDRHMELWRVESIGHWLATSVNEKIESVKSNDTVSLLGLFRVLSYLDLVSQYINANPAILNKDYGCQKKEENKPHWLAQDQFCLFDV